MPWDLSAYAEYEETLRLTLIISCDGGGSDACGDGSGSGHNLYGMRQPRADNQQVPADNQR